MLLKRLVQKIRHFGQKFENRLLGPTNFCRFRMLTLEVAGGAPMEKDQLEKVVQAFDDSLQKSFTHTRPDPKTQAPHSRPAPGSNGQAGRPAASSNGNTKKS
jgi:hypothetical protein